MDHSINQSITHYFITSLHHHIITSLQCHAANSHHHAAVGRSHRRSHRRRLAYPPGDQVAVDQDVIEVETNKATMNVTSPCPGKVNRLLVKLNESYPVGAVLGYLEATDEDARRLGLDQHAPGHGGGPDRARAATRNSTTKAGSEAYNRRCAGCRCRRTRPGPAICRPA